ncbi:hypothetical protein FRB97_008988 [Tulasnella sp. 331]|nr:hypothetical protein FRB97_008988 [Tulasnella sp. 331]
MSLTAAERKAILGTVFPNTYTRPKKMPHSFRATQDQLLATAEKVHATIPLLLVENFQVIWASTKASHGYILAARMLGEEDPWTFDHPIHLFVKKDAQFTRWVYHGQMTLLKQRLPDLDPEETLALGSEVQSALGVGSTSHRVRCIGFQYQSSDAKLSEAMTGAFNKPRSSRSVAPSPPPEKKRFWDTRSDTDDKLGKHPTTKKRREMTKSEKRH